MPSRNIAAILNNESNLRILEWLKSKPYYPRELAAEMQVSEQFIVRRLKAMEEHGIVEGKWESEGSRKVKRYYPRDITMELGKDGLTVTSDEPKAKAGIDLKKDLTRYLIKLPFILIIIYGIFFDVPVLIAAICVLLIWSATNNLSLYRKYGLKSLLMTLPIAALVVIMLTFMVIRDLYFHNIRGVITPVISVILLAAMFIFINYQWRFSQLEADETTLHKKEFISSLEPTPSYIKLFYLPMVLKWKVSEYFKLT